ncbi:MAG TPA: DUF6057 family protein [Bacteroidales bacterium]|jgi:hypothetical protein|nr:DUF6057 family protein [Bacteroidales bacterium]
MGKTNKIPAKENDIFLFIFLFFIIVFGYFCFLGNYVLYFQETQSLFIFSGDFLHQRLLKPGGLLEFAGRFLKQFYAGRVEGSLILASVLSLVAYIFHRINRRLLPDGSFTLPLILVPSSLLMLMQANYYHLMEYNLGFMMVLAFYLFFISSSGKWRRIAVLILFPLFYYIAGGYAMIFAGLYIIHMLFKENGRNKFYQILILLILAGLSFLVSVRMLFLEPSANLIFYPLPWLEDKSYRTAFIFLTAFVVLYPLICNIASRYGKATLNTRNFSLFEAFIILALSIIIILRIYNPQTSRVVEIQKLVFAGKYSEAASLHERKPSLNLIGQYFYNYALAESGQLCDRMFRGRQDFGYSALILPWGDVHLDRGAYFYYAVGLANEAHRWAYEEMTVYGYRPGNLKMLAKTSLINGDCLMARKYLSILEKTIYYRKWAKDLLKLADNPELIDSHPELGAKRKLLPKKNFFVQFNEPQNNLPLILEGNPDNRVAFEYYLAGLLLTKNVEEAVANVKKMKAMGYTKIPRHLEEAVMIIYNSRQIFPDVGGLPISADTQSRFSQYFTAYIAARQNPVLLKTKMTEKFSDTFWYYFHFK